MQFLFQITEYYQRTICSKNVAQTGLILSPKAQKKRNDTGKNLITRVLHKLASRKNNRSYTLKPDVVLLSKIRILTSVVPSGEASRGVSRSTGSPTAVSR